MKKKLLFMLTNMNVGGTEKSFLNLVNSIERDKYDITLLLLENYGGFMESIPPWVKVRFLEGYEQLKPLILDPPLPQIKALVKRGRLLRAFMLFSNYLLFKITRERSGYYRYILKNTSINEAFDAAIAYTGPFDFISLLVLDKVKAKKKIQWIHFDVTRASFNEAFAKKHYNRFDRIFTVSEDGRAALISRVPSAAEKTQVFYNIIDRRLVTAAAAEPCPAEADGRIRLLTVGRLTSEKGQLMVPEALKMLTDSGKDVVWYLVGYGAEQEKIEKKARELGVADRMVITGILANPYPYYRCCDIYVQTSFHEGYCITLTEARCFNKPIVTTDFPCASEQIHNGENGLTAGMEPAALAQAITRLLEDKALYDKISARLESEFDTIGAGAQRLYEIVDGEGA